ncbi:MAG: hypothetical protein ACRBG0_05470 [Lewinella sp.]|uniref:hypothetical protein n=1 Tax=Lewinella sp. TaxID=2004506 RepID=UPI003D6BD0A0
MLKATPLIILCWLMSFANEAKAQIGKEYWDLEVKGPVREIVMTNTFNFTDENGEVAEAPRNETTILVKNGHHIAREDRMTVGTITRSSHAEMDWDGDRLTMVREYSSYGEGKKRLTKRYQPLYDSKGVLVAENILDNKDKLMANLIYTHGVADNGNEIVQMTMYKPDYTTPQGHYYIESDEWGEVLHIESVGKDTGAYIQRISMVGDSVITLRHIIASREKRGTKDTFLVEQVYEYDTYGNVMFAASQITPVNQPELGIQRMQTQNVYYYEGDDLPSASSENAVPDLIGKWSSNGYNIELTFGSSNSPTTGIFSTDQLRENDPEIVEEGSDWIFNLRDAAIGEWYYDQQTKMITFKQAEYMLMKVKAEVVDYKLIMVSEGEYPAVLELEKKQ